MANSKLQTSSLVDDLARTLASGEGSDLTLVVEGSRLPAHSLILSMRSPVFAAMLRHDLKESSSHCIDLPDMEEEVARQLLHFIYTDEAPLLPRMASELLAASDMYDLPLLKQKCEQQLVLDLCVDNAAAAVVSAIQHLCPVLKKCAVEFIRTHTLDVMATEGWQKGLCSHPQMVAEVSHLVAAAPPLPQPLLPPPDPTPTQPPSLPPPQLLPTSSLSQSSEIRNVCEEVTRVTEQKLSELAAKATLELLGRELDKRAQDEHGNTAMHRAAGEGSEETVWSLLQAGAEVDVRNEWQQSPLHCAAGNGHKDVVRLLALASASVNARDVSKETPLHKAAWWGHAGVATVLLNAGADRGARNNSGKTPYDLALLRNKQHVLNIFREQRPRHKRRFRSNDMSGAKRQRI